MSREYFYLASNSRPSLLGLVQLANACANLFPRFWGIRIFLSKLTRIMSKKGRSVGKALSSPSFLAPSKYFSASLASVYLFNVGRVGEGCFGPQETNKGIRAAQRSW